MKKKSLYDLNKVLKQLWNMIDKAKGNDAKFELREYSVIKTPEESLHKISGKYQEHSSIIEFDVSFKKNRI